MGEEIGASIRRNYAVFGECFAYFLANPFTLHDTNINKHAVHIQQHVLGRFMLSQN